ncbi:hypothetical protein HDU85_000096 [Gaertneriomyces sp. JEL0708]|nr:hypothetical protein HDU85_000096 [Gaertneriomyces sp. JEL0708]
MPVPADANQPQHPITHFMQPRALKFKALPGFFRQYEASQADPDVWLLPPALGRSAQSWEAFWAKVERTRAQIGNDGQVGVLILQRHGEGIHNVAEQKYGKEAWDSYYSKLPMYRDAALTTYGVEQMQEMSKEMKKEIVTGLGPPSTILSSPLSRCLNTTRIIWENITESHAEDAGGASRKSFPQVPHVWENLREEYGVHTCDERRSRTELQTLFPSYNFTDLKADEDPFWTPNEREPLSHVDERVRDALGHMFSLKQVGESNGRGFISVVCHGGIVESAIRITGHPDFCVLPGGLLPMVVVAQYVN